MHLWHLFCSQEIFKLHTFLAGGLWCADLGSIIGFGNDVEGSGPQGLFVSCWHASEGDPTPSAWKIFGGDGDGFAIRTAIEELNGYAASFSNPILAARFGAVRYIPQGASIEDPAFEVPEHHKNEEEMRLLLELRMRRKDKEQITEQIQKAASRICEGRSFCSPIDQLTCSTRSGSDSDSAMILPIQSHTLFKEFVIGSKVEPRVATQAISALQRAGVQCAVRVLASRP